jgi:ABC-2 type transport system permease protein
MTSAPDTLAASSVRPLLAARMLCWREIVRFLRQRNRVIGALGQPILFWLLLVAGLQRSFRLGPGGSDEPSYLSYYYPGTLVLILLFTAIFATISIIEDRREGFLQSVLVSPTPRWAMVLGKVLGGTLIALLQGVLFLLLALLLPVTLSPLGAVRIVGLMFLAGVALTSLGFAIAWRMESTQGFHAIMNLALMPMWLLSGAFFPVPAETAGSGLGQLVLHWIMKLNPLTYTVAGVRQEIFSQPLPDAFWTPPSRAWCWLVTALFAAFMFAAAWAISGRRVRSDAV